MKIFLLWIGLVCCSIANGIIYDNVDCSERFNYILIPCIIASILLITHFIVTSKWEKTINNGRSLHPTVFSISAGVSFFVLIITLLSVKTNDASWGAAVGVTSAFVFFVVASLTEVRYTKLF